MPGRRSHGVPPVHCSATSKRSGEPCGKYATPGAVVCAAHGSKAPQVRDAAQRRTIIAQLLERDPRPLPVVLLDAVRVADSLMRSVEAQVLAADTVSADTIDRLVEATRLSHSLAKATVDAGVSAQMARHFELEASYIATGLDAGITCVLDELRVDPRRRAILHRWALDVASAACLGRPAPDRPEQLGPPMITGSVVADPATGAAAGATSAQDGPVADAAMRKPGPVADAVSGPQEPAEPAADAEPQADDGRDRAESQAAGGKPARPAAAERQAGDGDQADDEAEQQRRWANVVAMRRGNSGLLPPGAA